MSGKSKKEKTFTETLKKEDIVQAVIITDSFGDSFAPVKHLIPTALIPLVNVPILDYMLEFLSISGVHEVIIFCCSHPDIIKEHIRTSKWHKSPLITVTVIVSESCRSLGDAMRDLDAKAIVRGDFILISGNVVANVNLLPVLEKHRKRQKEDKGAAITLIYQEASPGHQTRCPFDETVLTVDSATDRVLVHHKLKSGMKKLNFPLEVFIDRPQVELLHNLLDTHIAICSQSVLPLFSDNFDFQTQEDFTRGLLMNEEILSSTIYHHILEPTQYAAQVNSWYMYQAVSHDIIHRWTFPLVPDAPISRDMDPYMFLRHNVYKQKSVKLAKGCILEEDVVIAEETNVAEHTFIACSVIGKNCNIGKNVIIKNSFIWNNVHLGDGVVLRSALIGHGCVLRDNVTLGEGCILSPGVVLPPNTKLESCKVVGSSDHYKSSGDQDADVELEKIAENAYIVHFGKSETDSEEGTLERRMSGLWLGLENEEESESDEEASVSTDQLSDRPSPLPDDTHMFFNEVMDSLARGYEDKLQPDNLILEINSSRYAYNVSVQEVNYHVVKAILSLPLQAHATLTTQLYLVELQKILREFLPILRNYIRNPEAQRDCLQALEDMASSTNEVRDVLVKLLDYFYDKDILTEDMILAWHSSTEHDTPTAAELRKQVLPFIQWLKEADEESESDESD